MTPPNKPVEGDALMELAAKCEQAAGLDRELDLAIELCLEGGRYDYPADNWPKDAPHYTASLDAAMTLVPEEALVNFTLSQSAMSVDMGGRSWRCQTGWRSRGSGRTPALALCAAALRARAARGE